MKKIILILLVVLIILATGFYFWQKRDIYFFKGEIKTKEEGNIDYDDIDNEEAGDFDFEEDGDEEDLNNNEEDIILIEEFEDDCKTECRNILDEEEHNYCLEICGFNESSDSGSGDCEKLEGFNKDVCFKKKAVQELDYSYCEKIEDDNVLKESCKNRVLEEIVEKGQGSLLEE